MILNPLSYVYHCDVPHLCNFALPFAWNVSSEKSEAIRISWLLIVILTTQLLYDHIVYYSSHNNASIEEWFPILRKEKMKNTEVYSLPHSE